MKAKNIKENLKGCNANKCRNILRLFYGWCKSRGIAKIENDVDDACCNQPYSQSAPGQKQDNPEYALFDRMQLSLEVRRSCPQVEADDI